MNPQWGGGINPPEPMPMGGAKSLRSDPGFIGGGLPSSGGGGGLSTSGGGIGGRQITKNPLNMLGGMGSTSNGVYTNGSSSSFDQVSFFILYILCLIMFTLQKVRFLLLLIEPKLNKYDLPYLKELNSSLNLKGLLEN